MTFNSEERVGVYSIAKIFTEEFGWIFREQPINDFGIDAFVEVTRIGLIPTGKLIAVQIKSGKSFFKEAKDESFVFRGSKKHLQYWLNHSIPVVLIIYDKDLDAAYWQQVNISTAILTGKSFKVNILKANLLKDRNREALANIAFFSSKYQYKLWQLQTSTEEIKLLIKRKLFLYIEVDSIPNSNYYYITLLVSDNDCENFPQIIYNGCIENPNRFEYSFYPFKDDSLKKAINDTIPWADLLVNGANFTDKILTKQIADDILSFNQEEFIQYVAELMKKNDFRQLACYLTGSYCFQLELKANGLTNAFLNINTFLNKEPIVKTRIYI